MAFATDMYDYAAPRSKSIGLPFGWQGFARFLALLLAAILTASWIMAALGTLEAIIPAYAPIVPVMRRLPLALGQQKHAPSQSIRQSFINAYTAQSAYSNLDWRRRFAAEDRPIITDIGPQSVIEVTPIADILGEKLAALKATALAYVTILQDAEPVRLASAEHSVPLPELAPERETKATVADFSRDEEFLPEDVPLPARKPVIAVPRKQAPSRFAYAPQTAETDSPGRRLFGTSHAHAYGNRVAVYDIAAATVYMPNGERLEAHSGLGAMRDNPNYTKQKNRGPTPPHTYNLRMREALFHGVEAIRLTPIDGNNRYNRDGLLAHTYMLRRRGDSNGCVVFRDYARFLRAFKRGDVKQLVVVPHMPAQNSARIASLF
ncbi:DUF2778 domain-containing protein [Brucella sp. BE17]|uniref:DUF2778 domain-containing protein n=1 Tax=Brucella sp. BE17 TaxID=3142977 RepID=UPI0031BB8C28